MGVYNSKQRLPESCVECKCNQVYPRCEEYQLIIDKISERRADTCPLEEINLVTLRKDWTVPSMIYDYLLDKLGPEIVNNPFEFEDWFNRMVWHVRECNRLTRELEKKEMLEV